MGLISEKLSAFYTKAEDKYFDVLDFLDGKGIPVYKYSDFFETRGIPSFVVTIALLLILLILLSLFFATTNVATNSIVLSMKDASGNSLTNVKITLTDAQGNIIGGINNSLKSDGDTLILPSLPQGTKLKLTATKTGYQTVSTDLILGKEKLTQQLRFDKDFTGIDASIILIDAETKTKVTEAVVLISWDITEFQFYPDSTGVYKQSGVPKGTTMLLKVKADGYNDLVQEISFPSTEPKTFLISPSNAGYVGKATLLVNVSSEDLNVVDNALVTIYNQTTGDVLLSDYTIQGTVTGTIQSGIPLKITVEKTGFLTYDSDKENGTYTIRKSEDRIDILLTKGGKKLTITSRDQQNGLSLDNSTIQIFDLFGNLLDSQVTSVTGTEFSGLNPDERVIITAYHDDYLPTRKTILVGATESEDLFLTKVTSTNSFRFDIYSIDEIGSSVSGAKITINQYTADGNIEPYGFSDLTANVAGYVFATVEKGKTYEIISQTSTLIGITRVEVNDALIDNKVYIKLSKRPNILEMKFKDPKGQKIIGVARVDGLDGTLLYDGNIYDSRVFFDAQLKETVEVNVILPDGNLFTENVFVKGKDIVEVIVYNKTASELSPTIEFVGLEKEDGTTVAGITPNEFYWAKFNVVFPIAASYGGVHFRAGPDSISDVSAGTFALFETSMQGATTYYGTTYTPTPAPGNEVNDRSNAGTMGEPNKWIENTISKPAGNMVVKVRVRASAFSAGKVQLQYRAWSNVGSEYYRTPEDTTIGTASLSETKAGLYATVNTTDLTLYESLPECSDNICVTTNFVDSSEKLYSPTEFEAITGKIYALEAELSATESDYLQVSVTSPSNLKFVGTQAGTFTFISDTTSAIDPNATASSSQGFTDRTVDTTSTSGAIQSAEAKTNISLTKNSKQKVRFYFKAISEGTAQISFSAIGTTTVTKELSFRAVNEKQLLLELNPNSVTLGRNFSVRVTDSGLVGIENALVKIMDKEGKVVKSVLGDSTDGKGKAGNYRIQNDLGVGLYTIEVSVPSYATKAETLLVTTQNVWTFPSDIVAKIPLGQKSTLVTEILENSSDFSISSITIEAENASNFTVTALAPSLLGKLQKQGVQIKIDYNGTASDSADETIQLTIKGMVEGKFYTQLSSTLNVTYNKKADPSCLVIVPSGISINMVGTQSSSDSEIIEVTNNCEEPVFLKARPREVTKRSGILISSEDISLNIGETKNVTINAVNGIDRTYGNNEAYNFEVVYDSNYVTKRVSVTVRLINPSIALSYPAQITLFLAQNDPSGKAFAAQPLYVTNISEFPVEGISFSTQTEYASGSNAKISIEPSGNVNLAPKASINPPKVVVAQSTSTISEPVQSQILINGKIGSLKNQGTDRYDYYSQYYDNYTNSKSNKTLPLSSYSPQNVSSGYTQSNSVLGIIDVIVYYSGYDCLKVYPLDELTYNLALEGAQIAKRIKMQNTCAEPIRITGVTTPTTNRDLILNVPSVMVPNDGSETVATLLVAALRPTIKLENYPIQVQGITEISQTLVQSQKLQINVYGGESIVAEGKATKGISVNVCSISGTVNPEKKTINVPKLASGTDCANGYCDAIQAGEYIAAKISQTIRTAQSKAYSNQQQSSAFSCISRGFCTFGELGIGQQSFDLYLQNDIVSGPVMESLVNKTAQGNTGFNNDVTGNYLVQMADVSDNVAEFIAQSGYGRTIIIDRGIQGCGFYRITINGAFNASAGKVQWELPTVIVSSNVSGAKKKITAECKDSIENIANFTPIDKGLTIGNNLSTWLTSVESETQLADLGKLIAKKQFLSEERYGNGSGNKIIIKQGALNGMLAQLCLTPGSGKKVIDLTVNSVITSTTGPEKEKINQQITKMVSEAISGSFGNNCLVASGNNYTCVQLKDVGDVNGLKLEVSNKTIRTGLNNNSYCTPATLYSKVPETLNFEFTKGEKFGGINKITVLDASSLQLIAEWTPNTEQITSGTNTISTESNNDSRTKKESPFKKDINICVEIQLPNQGTIPDQAKGAYLTTLEGSTFIVTAINKTAGKTTGTLNEDGTIIIRTSSIHPDDLIKLLGEHKIEPRGIDKPYYVTLTWSDSSELIDSFDKYRIGLTKLGINNNIELSQTEGLVGNKATQTKLLEGKKSALTSYITTCLAVTTVCNVGASALTAFTGVGFIAGLGNMAKTVGGGALLDCGLPVVTVFQQDFRDAFGPADSVYKAIYGGLSNLPEWMGGNYFKELAEGSKLSEKSFASSLIISTAGKAAFITPPNVRAIKEAQKTVTIKGKAGMETKLIEDLTKGQKDTAKAITDNAKNIEKFVGTSSSAGIAEDATEQLIQDTSKLKSKITAAAGTFTAGSIERGLVDSAATDLKNIENSFSSAKVLINQASLSIDPKEQLMLLEKANNIINQAVADTKLVSETLTNAASATTPAKGRGIKALATQVETVLKRHVTNAAQVKDAKDTLSKVDELAKAAKEADEALKAGKSASKLSIAKSITKLGSGVLCSILSNAAGIQAYNDSMKESTIDLYSKASLISDQPMEKDATYKMTITRNIESAYDATFEKVDTPEELAQMSKDLTIDITTKKSNGEVVYWTEALNKKAPYDRTLSLYLMKNDIQKLRQLLKKYGGKELDADAIDKIISRITNPQAQQIIYNYTNERSDVRLSSADNRYVDEMMTAAVIGAFYDTIGEKGLQTEVDSKTGFIKDRSLLILDSLKANDSFAFTNAEALLIANGDAKKAQILHIIVNALYVQEHK